METTDLSLLIFHKWKKKEARFGSAAEKTPPKTWKEVYEVVNIISSVRFLNIDHCYI